MQPRWQRTLLAFAAAAGVAWLGVMVGAEVRRWGPGEPGFGVLVYLLFGWPFAIAATLGVVPVYLLIRRAGYVTAPVVVAIGVVTGTVVGAFAFEGSAFYCGWCAGVGGMAGSTWWHIWRGSRASGAGAR